MMNEQRRIVAYLDGLQAKTNALRELQSAGGEGLSALCFGCSAPPILPYNEYVDWTINLIMEEPCRILWIQPLAPYWMTPMQ